MIKSSCTYKKTLFHKRFKMSESLTVAAEKKITLSDYFIKIKGPSFEKFSPISVCTCLQYHIDIHLLLMTCKVMTYTLYQTTLISDMSRLEEMAEDNVI